MGYSNDTPDYEYLQANNAWGGPPPGWSQQGDSMINQNWSAPSSGGGMQAIGAGASGIGAILALAPKLLGEAKQRAIQKQIAKIQAQQQRQDYLKNLTDMAISEEGSLRQGAQAEHDLTANLAAHGFSGMNKSSVSEQGLAELKFQREQGLDTIRRSRARMKSGYAAQLKIQDLQAKAAKSAAMYDTIAQVGNAVGQAAGAAAAFSDPKLKKDIKPVEKGALEIVVATPVKSWNYKADPVNPRLGPMADEVKENMGEEVSDGHQIDMVSMNGMLMKAVQELAAEVKALKEKK